MVSFQLLFEQSQVKKNYGMIVSQERFDLEPCEFDLLSLLAFYILDFGPPVFLLKANIQMLGHMLHNSVINLLYY